MGCVSDKCPAKMVSGTSNWRKASSSVIGVATKPLMVAMPFAIT